MILYPFGAKKMAIAAEEITDHHQKTNVFQRAIGETLPQQRLSAAKKPPKREERGEEDEEERGGGWR